MAQSHKQSFTLIELLIVLIIIGVIATMAVPQFKVIAWNARVAEATNNMGAICRAMAAYYAEKGDLPCTYTGSYIPLEFIITVPPSKYWRYLYMTAEATPPVTTAGILVVPVNSTPEEVDALITDGAYTNSVGVPENGVVLYWLRLRTIPTTPMPNEEVGGVAFGNFYRFYSRGILKGGGVVYKAGW